MVELLFFISLMITALVTGTVVEKRHYRSIRKRELRLENIPCSSFRAVPDPRPPLRIALAQGSAVISSDRFKILLGNLISIFGGEMRSHSSVIDRARREATLRMKESCPWAECFINMRMETSNISEKHTQAAVLVYATALSFGESLEAAV